VRIELTNLFKKYESNFGVVRLQRSLQSCMTLVGKSMSRVTFFGTSDPSTQHPSPSITPAIPTGHVCELNYYLDSVTISDFNGGFVILSWWQTHK
jgi:hypothetical protein